MVWHRDNRVEWKNTSVRVLSKPSTITIEHLDGLYYVRQYNLKGVLLDSLAEGTFEDALKSVKQIIRPRGKK